MNRIKQNKITFVLILTALAIIFSSLTILSLPVLFNYKSKVTVIEKNFYKNFKIHLITSGKISYKPFPKPHLLVEKASINFNKIRQNDDFINTSDLRIFISLRNVYLRNFNNLISTEISNTNLDLKISNLYEIREHLYQKINKPIIFNNCKIFIKNKKNEVILISPLKKIIYKIHDKKKVKSLDITGEIFGLTFRSDWKRNYSTPKFTYHDISILNPNIEIKNIFEFDNNKKFKVQSEASYFNDKLKYLTQYDTNKIKISSPNNKKTNYNLDSKIQLNPFYFEGELTIKNKKIEKILDFIFSNFLSYDESYIGNFNGLLKIKFDKLSNKLIKKGELELFFNEKKINLKKAKFNLDKIGYINTKVSFVEDRGDLKFISKNQLKIENYIEFAKTFQISSKKIKNIKQINFDLIRNIGQTDLIITNIKINNIENKNKSNKVFIVKNIQNLRSHIRNVID